MCDNILYEKAGALFDRTIVRDISICHSCKTRWGSECNRVGSNDNQIYEEKG